MKRKVQGRGCGSSLMLLHETGHSSWGINGWMNGWLWEKGSVSLGWSLGPVFGSAGCDPCESAIVC